MIQFAKAIGLEVSMAAFGMLEDVLLEIGGKTGKSGGDKNMGQSPLFSKAGSTFFESVASRSYSSLLNIIESLGGDPCAGDPSQHSCSRRQADAALGFSKTQVTDITGSDSLKLWADWL